MLAKSLITKNHPDKQPYKKYSWVFRNGKTVEIFTIVQPVLCVEGEEIGVLGRNDYAYKSGSFYFVINKKDEVFSLDENEIDCKEKIAIKIKFVNKTPLFIDCIEPETFSLDFL